MILISFALAVIPSIGLVIYFYKKDKANPEPKGLVLRVFIVGLLSVVPAIILELIAGAILYPLVSSPLALAAVQGFLIAALCEEGIKLGVIRITIYKHPAFDEVMDGIVYTVAASLGFACMENLMYVLDGDLSVILVRAFTAIPLHAAASGIMGYFIGKARVLKEEPVKNILLGLGIAIFIHGLYDFILFAWPASVLGFFIVFLISSISLVILKRITSQLNKPYTVQF